MVAISGGKDSYSLLVLLGASAVAPAVPSPAHGRAPGPEAARLRRSVALNWLESSGFNYEILSEDTYSVVTEHVKPGATYCSLCSRLRRGILYTAAERLGCNKIALGHHRDDALETFLMNLFFAGKLQAMPPKYTTDDGRFEVIRPLLQCAEETIRWFADEQNFPILPCNLCGSQPGLIARSHDPIALRPRARQPELEERHDGGARQRFPHAPARPRSGRSLARPTRRHTAEPGTAGYRESQRRPAPRALDPCARPAPQPAHVLRIRVKSPANSPGRACPTRSLTAATLSETDCGSSHSYGQEMG